MNNRTFQLAVAGAALIAAPAALAADGSALGELSVGLIDLAAGIAGVVGLALLRRVMDWLRISADDKVRRHAEEAFRLALDWAHQRALAQDRPLTAAAVVEDAAGYLKDKVPDTLRRFRIDEEGLRERLAARLAVHGPWFVEDAPSPGDPPPPETRPAADHRGPP